jgi:hypothetical protein
VSDGFEVDFSDVMKLAADMGHVDETLAPLVRKAIEVTARKVKDSAKAKVAAGSSSWSGLPNTIDYDLHGTTGARLGGISAEVGYNKSRGGGKLGNIREFGAPAKNRGPHNDLANALEENQDDFQRGLEIAASDAEKAAGL